MSQSYVPFGNESTCRFVYFTISLSILTKQEGYSCQSETVGFLTVRMTREKIFIAHLLQ